MTSGGKLLWLIVEIVLFVVAIVFAIRWIANPQGPFEPTIALCTLLLGVLGLFRNRFAPGAAPPRERDAAGTLPEERPSPVVATQSHAKAVVPTFAYASDSAFFSARFGQAFPGVRGVKWFKAISAVERLAVLLAEPLVFARRDGGFWTPIWWFRDGNLQIESFRVLDRTIVLLDTKELQVSRLAAVYSNSYSRVFVYLEAEGMQPTGLYPRTQQQLDSTKQQFGYVWEEYGLYRDQHMVTRAEYDDGAAQIMGKVVRINDRTELRERFLTPFNLIIAPQDSPINNSDFDSELVVWMNRLLADSHAFDEFLQIVQTLPLKARET